MPDFQTLSDSFARVFHMEVNGSTWTNISLYCVTTFLRWPWAGHTDLLSTWSSDTRLTTVAAGNACDKFSANQLEMTVFSRLLWWSKWYWEKIRSAAPLPTTTTEGAPVSRRFLNFGCRRTPITAVSRRSSHSPVHLSQCGGMEG